MRFKQLETLREFAAEQWTISFENSIRKNHAEYFLKYAENARPHFVSDDQVDWFKFVDRERANLISALDWCWSARETEANASIIGLRIATALKLYWDFRGHAREGQNYLQKFLNHIQTKALECSTELQINALNALSHIARSRLDFPLTISTAEYSLELCKKIGNQELSIEPKLILGTMSYFTLDFDKAEIYIHEALETAQMIGDSQKISASLINLGNIAMERRDWTKAWDLYSSCLSILRTTGSPKNTMDVLNNMGLVARYKNDLSTARTLFQEAISISKSFNSSSQSIEMLNLGAVNRLSGDFEQAKDLLQNALKDSIVNDNKRSAVWCIKEFGNLACAQKQWRRGIRLLAAAENIRKDLGISFNPADPEDFDRDTGAARLALGDEEFEAHWLAGSALKYENAISEALVG
jgi:tetratricopeptide (TPR) repeat protein